MRSLIVVALLSSTAQASETVSWKDIPGWNISVDKTMGNACFVNSTYEDNTILRMGFDFRGASGKLYIALGNAKWKSLETGKDYPIKIQFDNNPIWDASAQVRVLNGINFLTTVTSDSNFADEFGRKHSLTANYNGRQIAALRLKGSALAIKEMLACQDAVNSAFKAPATPSDPFEQNNNVKNSDDPFDL